MGLRIKPRAGAGPGAGVVPVMRGAWAIAHLWLVGGRALIGALLVTAMRVGVLGEGEPDSTALI